MTATTTDDAPVAHTFPRWRRFLAGLLVVLSCILVPLSVIAIWTRNQILDTNRYVENVAPLASNPAIQDAAATEATNELFANVDVEAKLKDALPDRAQVIAGPVSGALKTFTHAAALRVLETDQFQQVWKQANRRAHDRIENALTGGGKIISTKNGKIELDLTPIILNIRKQLDGRGVTVFDSIPINKLALKFQLFDASGLKLAQTGVDLLNKLAYALPILVFVFLGLAIWLSPRRRRTIIRWGIGITIAAGITAVLVAVGRGVYLDAVTSPQLPRDALAATWDTLIRFLRGGLRLVMVLGLLVAFITWLTGPGTHATRFRTTVAGTIGGAGDSAGAHGMDLGGFGRWVHRAKKGLQVGGILVAVLFFLVANQISASRLLWITVVLLLYLAIVEFISRAAVLDEPATPDAEPEPDKEPAG